MTSHGEQIVVIGHSFVHWFDRFLQDNPEKDHDLAMGVGKVEYRGLRGGKSEEIFEKWGELMKRKKPQAIVVVTGCNDIGEWDDGGEKARELGRDIVKKARDLQRGTGASVYLTELFPRYPPAPGKRNRGGRNRRPFNRLYNRNAEVVNGVLRMESDNVKEVSVWSHEFVAFPDGTEGNADASQSKYLMAQGYFRPDGVHLNDAGNYQLYRSLGKLLKRRTPRRYE